MYTYYFNDEQALKIANKVAEEKGIDVTAVTEEQIDQYIDGLIDQLPE